MVNLPTIDMIRTGQNINRLRKQAGLSVRDLQDIFGFATPQAIYKWQQGATLPTIVLSVKLDAPAPCRLDAPDLDLICYASADCLHQHLQVI